MKLLSSWKIRATISLVVALAYPFVDVWQKCRLPLSEACVWGKSYLPLTIGFSLVLIGGGLFLALSLLSALVRR